MQDTTIDAVAFRALGEPVRLQILRLLVAGERCACDLLSELEIKQPTLSHHMRILTESGLVAARRSGLWVHYSLCPDAVLSLSDTLSGLLRPFDAGMTLNADLPLNAVPAKARRGGCCR